MSKVISIFGSSRPVEGDADFKTAYDLGRELARSGYKVCNGGYGGIMAASAKGAKEAGGSTIGVTTRAYKTPANSWIDKEIKLATPMDRLFMLVELGDAYVVLKGGTGTLLEFACVWEFINKQVIPEKPILVMGSFWYSVVELLRSQMPQEGYVEASKFVQRVDSADGCIKVLKKKLQA
jgi:hypothetical protein